MCPRPSHACILSRRVASAWRAAGFAIAPLGRRALRYRALLSRYRGSGTTVRETGFSRDSRSDRRLCAALAHRVAISKSLGVAAEVHNNIKAAEIAAIMRIMLRFVRM